MKRLTIGRGEVKNWSKLRDVIYEWPWIKTYNPHRVWQFCWRRVGLRCLRCKGKCRSRICWRVATPAQFRNGLKLKGTNLISMLFFYQERCSNPRPSGCVVTKYFYLSYEGYRKKITWLRTSPSLQSLSLLSWPPFLASLWQSRIFLPSSRLHAMAGVGFPFALQVRATRMPSVANVSELLSSSIMSGGTEWRNNNMI